MSSGKAGVLEAAFLLTSAIVQASKHETFLRDKTSSVLIDGELVIAKEVQTRDWETLSIDFVKRREKLMRSFLAYFTRCASLFLTRHRCSVDILIVRPEDCTLRKATLIEALLLSLESVSITTMKNIDNVLNVPFACAPIYI